MDVVDGCSPGTGNGAVKSVEKNSSLLDDTRYDSGFDSSSLSSVPSWFSAGSEGSESLKEQLARLSLKEESENETPADDKENDNVYNSDSELKDSDDGCNLDFDLSGCTQCGRENFVNRITDDSLVIYGKDCDGDTLLHIAIIQEATDLVMQFIQAAPWYDWLDIYNDKLRQTPLHLATIMGLTPVVRRLVVGGANVEMCDHNGDTALHIACELGNEAIVSELLRPIDEAETRVNEYTSRDQMFPQNLEMRNYDGHTCLHIAARKSHTNIMKLLLENGAQINAGDGKSGATVLHYAADRNDTTLGEFILSQKGISVDKEMYNGATALMVARGRRNSDIVELLAQYGANCSKLSETSSSSSSEDD